MKDAFVEQRSSAATQETNASRREWIKPEVKSAEVVQATLAGHTTLPVSDFTTCAS
jgi:hypothetical protein